ncbi:MAG: phosphate ABC transporter substrate-binding protein [Lachnospiraceae bacterium]
MKKKMISIVTAAMLATCGLVGCQSTASTTTGTATESMASTESAAASTTVAASTTAASAETTISGTITMAGSTSMEKFATALSESMMEQYPDITVTAEYTGSSAGIEAVTAGSVDIGNSSRSLKDSEKEAGIVENIVAIDGIAVVVDPANTVKGLSKEQLSGIYTGKIKNWSEVGGTDAPIVVVGREAGSGTRGAFEEILEVADACAYANELDSTGAVMAKVASTPGAIGYVSLDVVDDTVVAIAIEEIEPRVENIKGGSYLLSRPFVMATRGEITEQSEAVQAMFAYLSTQEGKTLIQEVGLITVD